MSRKCFAPGSSPRIRPRGNRGGLPRRATRRTSGAVPCRCAGCRPLPLPANTGKNRSDKGRAPLHDGWEHRGGRLIAYGIAAPTADLALELLTWSRNITFCATFNEELSPGARIQLEQNGIAIAASPIAALGGRTGGALTEAHFEDGTTLPCDALFFRTGLPQRSSIVCNLGCHLDEEGSVVCVSHAATGVPGLYVAGNVRRGVHLAIMAAAEGTEAAIAINEELAEQEQQRRG